MLGHTNLRARRGLRRIELALGWATQELFPTVTSSSLEVLDIERADRRRVHAEEETGWPVKAKFVSMSSTLP